MSTYLKTRIAGIGAIVTVVVASGCAASPALEEWTLGLEEVMAIGGVRTGPHAVLDGPSALGFDYEGNVFVLDSGYRQVHVFSADGEHVRSIGPVGAGSGRITNLQGMFVHPDGRVWLADTHGNRIRPYGTDGTPGAPIRLEFPPRDLVVTDDRLFVQRMPGAGPAFGDDRTPMVIVLDHAGRPTGAIVAPVAAPDGTLYALENGLEMAPAPGGGIAVANTHFSSLIRTYRRTGGLDIEIPVLYKAQAWAPLGRRPIDVNDASTGRSAHTCSDLAWDRRRRLFWVLAGYVDRTPEGEWIVGREVYRYGTDGTYRGSLMLPHRATTLAAGPDGRIWTIDVDGVVHAFRLTDPDTRPPPDRPG